MIRKLLFTFSTIFICFTLCSTKVKATHAAGADLIYEWVSDSTYRFIFKFYRDCGGIPEPDSVLLCYYNSCGVTALGVHSGVWLHKVNIIPPSLPNGSKVNPGCPGVLTRCDYPPLTSTGQQPSGIPPGTLPGYREWWYTGTFTVPSRCDFWTFYTTIYGRNPSDNIIGNGYLMYIEATMNNKAAQGFSSPYFSVKPVPYTCINTPNSYGNGPVDPNNDSMGFECITPRYVSGGVGGECYATNRITDHLYVAPFNTANPFSTNNTLVFDPITSIIRFTPAAISVNTITIRANKFRRGVKIGSVVRDIQIPVITCTSPPIAQEIIRATVTGARLVNDIVEGCYHKPFSFCFRITTSLAGSKLVAVDNHGIVIPSANITYQYQGTDSVIGCFSWALPDTGFKLLSITVIDTSCHAPGVVVPQTFTIPIHVNPLGQTFKRLNLCQGDSLTLTSTGSSQIKWMVVPGGAAASSIGCDTCKHTSVKPDVTTTYIDTFNTLTTCTSGDTIVITVVPTKITVTPQGPLVFCEPDSLHLSAQATGLAPFLNLACGLSATTPTTDKDSIMLALDKYPQYSNVAGTYTPFNGNYVTARHQFLVKAKDLMERGMRSGSFRSITFFTGGNSAPATFRNFTLSIKCTNQPLNSAGAFQSGAVPVYSASSVVVPASGSITFDFNQAYDWDTTQNILVEICYANTAATSVLYIPYYNTAYNASVYDYNTSGNICTGTAGLTGGIVKSVLPQMQFNYYKAPTKPFEYMWSNGTFYPSDTAQSPTAYVSRTRRIFVTAQGGQGCPLSGYIDVIVPIHRYGAQDRAICIGNETQLAIVDTGNENTPVTSYKWYENGGVPTTLSCDNCSNPVAKPSVTTMYTSIIKDNVDCEDTLNVAVKVKPLPAVDILNNDTTISYGQSVQLTATGAETYVWWPKSSLDVSTSATPIATPTETTQYSVMGMSEGCINTDTMNIFVDYRGVVFIPDAFTPNGDGLNDVFRVVNLTFQKIVEFRVFNRWGQQVYFTNDNKQGWDGMWKGTPQDLGTYHYLIRLSYPDGFLQSFKGNVTLIR